MLGIIGRALLIFFVLTHPGATSETELKEIQTRISNQTSELKNLETELDFYRKTLKNLSDKESAILKTSKVLEADLLRQESQVEALTLERYQIEREVRSLEEKLIEEKSAETEAGCLLNQVAMIYLRRKILAETLPWYSYHIISEPSPPAPGDLVRFTAEEYEIISKKAKKTARLKGEKEAKMKRLISLERELVSLQNTLIRKKQEQITLLAGIRKERDSREGDLRKLEEEKARLSELLANLRMQAVDIERLNLMAKGFLAAKGKLPYPVEGKIISFFGKQRHPKLDADIYNRGLVIKASSGSLVRTVGKGVVVFTGSVSSMKQVVVIDHGKNYYTLYGRLETTKVQPGDEVEPAGIIGVVASENLYFELGLDSSPLDPSDWLTDNSGD
ncbi:MAG: peptidoglycan DD-metalloendopeptidase family protein [Elusimicrobia bacterium]|nr:peptidoglycan DD-metalloendopeptidase family protein [Elusimicrobiota bacterium]